MRIDAGLIACKSVISVLQSPIVVHAFSQVWRIMVDSDVQVCEDKANFNASSHPQSPPFQLRHATWSAENSCKYQSIPNNYMQLSNRWLPLPLNTRLILIINSGIHRSNTSSSKLVQEKSEHDIIIANNQRHFIYFISFIFLIICFSFI